MSGQYNVMKNAQGNPGTRAVKIWEKEHPSELKFNKIDIASVMLPIYFFGAFITLIFILQSLALCLGNLSMVRDL